MAEKVSYSTVHAFHPDTLTVTFTLAKFQMWVPISCEPVGSFLDLIIFPETPKTLPGEEIQEMLQESDSHGNN